MRIYLTGSVNGFTHIRCQVMDSNNKFFGKMLQLLELDKSCDVKLVVKLKYLNEVFTTKGTYKACNV